MSRKNYIQMNGMLLRNGFMRDSDNVIWIPVTMPLLL